MAVYVLGHGEAPMLCFMWCSLLGRVAVLWEWVVLPQLWVEGYLVCGFHRVSSQVEKLICGPEGGPRCVVCGKWDEG